MFNIYAKLPNNLIIAFLIGLSSAYPSLLPTIISLKKDDSCEMYTKAKLEDMLLYIPIFYGLLHIFLFFIINKSFPNNLKTFWVLGIIIGILYPTFGTITGHAKEVYGIKETWKLYLYAQILYIIFYALIVNSFVSNI